MWRRRERRIVWGYGDDHAGIPPLRASRLRWPSGRNDRFGRNLNVKKPVEGLYMKAERPVMRSPMISLWMSLVPS